jgi:F-type H+-transporting ATPase subunit b
MAFNISTFVLEIINFLVLIWILQRLFYKPLLEVIAKRKQFIDQSLADAKTIQKQAEAQKNLYENRLKLWEQEKQTALAALNQQLEAEKRAQLDKLSAELEQEKQKAQLIFSHQQQQLLQQQERQAAKNAARFAGLLLQQAATPELEARLCKLLLEQWSNLPEACNGYFQTLKGSKAVVVNISSTFPLPLELQHALEQKLASLTQKQIDFKYREDPALMAGVRIDMGAWVLNANLQHELVGFAEIANVSE